MIIKSAAVQHFIDSARVPTGQAVQRYQKKFAELSDLYEDHIATQVLADQIAYTVYSYSAGDPELIGNLNWGMTVLHPVTINDECNMTRGHFHDNRDYAEFYFGISGEGLLLLMNEQGETWAEKVEKGSLHHIDGHLAHRLVNTGDVDFTIGACWNTKAGHDYAAIDKRPFGYRIYKKGQQLIFKELKI